MVIVAAVDFVYHHTPWNIRRCDWTQRFDTMCEGMCPGAIATAAATAAMLTTIMHFVFMFMVLNSFELWSLHAALHAPEFLTTGSPPDGQ